MDPYVISIDLGGTNIRCGIVSNKCEIIEVNREKTIKNDKEKLLNQIISLIKKLPYKDYNITKIGISACGFVENNVITRMTNLGIYNFNLKKLLENEFPDLTVSIKNDANCTALAESMFGSSKDYNSSFFITISTGIGGGLVYNKELIDLPFETGNMLINYKDKVHHTEKLLSGTGIVNLCKENDLIIDNAEIFFNMVKEKNEKALKIFDIWQNLLAQLIVSNHFNFNTDIYVLSGGVMKSQDLFYNDLLKKCNDLIEGYPLKEIKFVSAYFDQDAGLIGGATVALTL